MKSDHPESTATLPLNLLREFQDIWKRRFSEDLPDEQALAEALSFLGLIRAIYRPIPLDRVAVYKALEKCYKEGVPPTQ